MLLAYLVLALHIVVIAFNLFGLIAIPLGARYGWAPARAPTWRLLHILSWAVVAAQAVAGRACFLTIWQDDLAGSGEDAPLIMRWINAVVFWPLPMWVFALLYVAAFAYVLGLLWLVPLRWKPAR